MREAENIAKYVGRIKASVNAIRASRREIKEETTSGVIGMNDFYDVDDALIVQETHYTVQQAVTWRASTSVRRWGRYSLAPSHGRRGEISIAAAVAAGTGADNRGIT